MDRQTVTLPGAEFRQFDIANAGHAGAITICTPDGNEMLTLASGESAHLSVQPVGIFDRLKKLFGLPHKTHWRAQRKGSVYRD